jgi:hypothetical protein
MTRKRKWGIRFLVLLQVLTVVSVGWAGLRHQLFPNGTTPAEAVIVFFILIVWEDVLLTRWRVEAVINGPPSQ